MTRFDGRSELTHDLTAEHVMALAITPRVYCRPVEQARRIMKALNDAGYAVVRNAEERKPDLPGVTHMYAGTTIEPRQRKTNPLWCRHLSRTVNDDGSFDCHDCLDRIIPVNASTRELVEMLGISSVAERPPVKRDVPGSSPGSPARCVCFDPIRVACRCDLLEGAEFDGC